MRQVLTAGGSMMRLAVDRLPQRRTLAVTLSLNFTASKPIFRAIASDHSRVLIAVLPARHIDAPKEISTSTPSSEEVGVPLLSVSDEGFKLLFPRLGVVAARKCELGA
jgi:hypothetical protein